MWVSRFTSYIILRKEFRDDKNSLYRDDGLSYIQNLSISEFEKKKQKLCIILKQHRSNITVECNLQITDFLYAAFDLRNRHYYPYTKVNKEFYNRKQSNHPSTITK